MREVVFYVHMCLSLMCLQTMQMVEIVLSTCCECTPWRPRIGGISGDLPKFYIRLGGWFCTNDLYNILQHIIPLERTSKGCRALEHDLIVDTYCINTYFLWCLMQHSKYDHLQHSKYDHYLSIYILYIHEIFLMFNFHMCIHFP